MANTCAYRVALRIVTQQIWTGLSAAIFSVPETAECRRVHRKGPTIRSFMQTPFSRDAYRPPGPHLGAEAIPLAGARGANRKGDRDLSRRDMRSLTTGGALGGALAVLPSELPRAGGGANGGKAATNILDSSVTREGRGRNGCAFIMLRQIGSSVYVPSLLRVARRRAATFLA